MLIGQHGSSHEWITASAITSLKQTGEYTGTVNALAIDATEPGGSEQPAYDSIMMIKDHSLSGPEPRGLPIVMSVRVEDGLARH